MHPGKAIADVFVEHGVSLQVDQLFCQLRSSAIDGNSNKTHYFHLFFKEIAMKGVVTHYIARPAAPHFFSENDIGKKFVRTDPHYGDWSFVPETSDISQIRKEAMKLVGLCEDYLRLRQKRSIDPDVMILERDTPEKWDDGKWISVEVLAKGLSEGNISLEAHHMRCAGWY